MKISPYQIAIEDYNYILPSERIAEFPLQKREGSKLLVYEHGKIKECHFFNIVDELPSDSNVLLNNTKVIEARLLFQKDSGGVIEIFCLEPVGDLSIENALQYKRKCQWMCLIGGAPKWKVDQILKKDASNEYDGFTLTAKYISKEADGFIVEFEWNTDLSFAEVLHAAGAIPLPPYIKRKAEKEDSITYQTVFASHEGSVAAPTAALHFTEAVFDKLKAKQIQIDYVTLHVGAGTFKPVKSKTINEHSMHAEEFHISKAPLQKLIYSETIIAVGTTTIRTLESLYWIGIKYFQTAIKKDEFVLHQWEAYELENNNLSYKEIIQKILDYMDVNGIEELFCKTSLLIAPGYEFKSAKALITNFHQPQSTLLLLVAAFIGQDWKKVYNYALENDYRFLSYGDSSLLWRNG